jgi:hypothetical protein
MAQIRAELVRSLLKFFGERGGHPGDPTAVAVADDLNQGAFPPALRWFGSHGGVASAGVYRYVGAANRDAADSGSLLVIDRLIFRMTVAGDLTLAIVNSSVITLAEAGVYDMAPEATVMQAATLAPKVGNVIVGQQTSATPWELVTYPYNDTLVHELAFKYPIVLGPQEQLLAKPSAVNVGIFAAIEGRYYAPR